MTVCVCMCVSHHPWKLYFCNEVVRVTSRGVYKQSELWSREIKMKKHMHKDYYMTAQQGCRT